jgi:hypothetical protein
MLGNEYQLKVLELLVMNEKLVSKLYTIYSEMFPEESAFWKQKVREENTHAELLQSLWSLLREGGCYFDQNRFRIEPIQLSVDYLKKTIEEARTHSLLNALSVAKSIENGLIEQNFFKFVAGDSPELSNILSDIEGDTRRHREEIGRLLDKYNLKGR